MTQCKNILNFTDSLAKFEVKAYAFLTLFKQVVHSSLGMFSPEGSDCVFQLAWRADQLGKRQTNSEEPKAVLHLSNLKRTLPLAVR